LLAVKVGAVEEERKLKSADVVKVIDEMVLSLVVDELMVNVVFAEWQPLSEVDRSDWRWLGTLMLDKCVAMPVPMERCLQHRMAAGLTILSNLVLGRSSARMRSAVVSKRSMPATTVGCLSRPYCRIHDVEAEEAW
jgi:hypothetical protein